MSKTGEWMVFLSIFCVISIVMSYFGDVDPTDRSRWTRSGMAFHIDHGTGCQYLGGLTGPPTPRLDENGKHICR